MLGTAEYSESPYYSHIIVANAHHSGQYSPCASSAAHYQYDPCDPAISFHSSTYDSVGYFPLDGPLQGQHQHSLVPVPSGYSHYDDYISRYEHYAQPPILPILPSSSFSELGHALVETPPPESQPIRVNHGSIALPSLPMSSPSSPKHGQSDTLVGLNPVETEYASGVNGQPFSPMTLLDTVLLSSELALHPKEESQERTHLFPTPAGTHGHPHHRSHVGNSFRLQDPAMYMGHTSPPPFKRCPRLAIPGQLAYSPGAHNPTPLSSSFSSSDIGTPTSSIHLDMNAASPSQVPAPASALNPMTGVLKLPSRKRSARHKARMACLFCCERKIACKAPPEGSADGTCK
ncbi:hypothetical protein EDB85DRAFT_2143188 [Lactarius pseudohatsudake]|nr:hypothetical protein EDB85DRAFT_2143188 [Lactarius pseudohatsudake]